MITWQLALVLHLMVWTLGQSIQKRIVDKLPRGKALALFYFFGALIMWLYVLIFGGLTFEKSLLLIVPVGFLNAMGAYFQWRAYEFSFSKTVLFIPLSAVVTIVLAAIFLGEAAIYNLWMITGIILLISATYLLKEPAKNSEQEKINFKWLLFVLGFVFIFGTTVFIMKIFSSTDVSQKTFLLYWYSSSVLGTLPILWLERKDKRKVFTKTAWLIPFSSIFLVGSWALVYLAVSLAPLGVVEPIRRFGMSVLPIPVGWFLYKEKRNLSKLQVLGFIIGALGAFLVIRGIY
jgi:drug/metabolite transporter (DMT)-like permease